MKDPPASTLPPPLQNLIRVGSKGFPTKPSQIAKLQFTPVVLLLGFLLSVHISAADLTPFKFPRVEYSDHCKDVVPESSPAGAKINDATFLPLRNAYYTGGDPILGEQKIASLFSNSVSFKTRNVYPTHKYGVFKLEGTLSFRGRRVSVRGNFTRRQLRLVHYRPPRIPLRNRDSSFRLSGFWSSASGMLCMVGSGLNSLRSVNVVLRLNYPKVSTISTSSVNGTLKSIEPKGGSNYFQPILIFGVSLLSYEYTLIVTENKKGGFNAYDKMENISLGLEPGRVVCSVIQSSGSVVLDYGNGCDKDNCNPLGGGQKFLPASMSFNEIECLENGNVRYLLSFSNSSHNGYQLPFDPFTTLVAEGTWDRKKKRLILVACQFLSAKDLLVESVIGDCSIRLSLRVPAMWSLRNRSSVIGQLWSTRSSNDSSYFSRLAFWSPANKNMQLKGLNYEYYFSGYETQSCLRKMEIKVQAGAYPSGYSTDMRFDMAVKNKHGLSAWGYSSPLFVGDEFYHNAGMFRRTFESAAEVNHSNRRVLNISFVMSFGTIHDFKLNDKLPPAKLVEVSAEGVYDGKTGLLCMIGCRHLASQYEKSLINDSFDCKLAVNAHYPSLNSRDGSNVRGTIESTRIKSDPLYFERLDFSSSSIYTSQAKESIWRMDLEITMVLISNTLACIFVGMQLFYTHKHPGVLPFISVIMVIVLTLAHMIPLLLNFEALFVANHNQQNVFLGSGRWLEVNELLVRVITMIAFLLQFRLLQLTWSARVVNDRDQNLWVYDKNVLFLSLPLYIGGGLFAWFAHLSRKSHPNPLLGTQTLAYKNQSFWGVMKSYAGLVLDGFLLPQILFNLYCDTRETALAPSFYVGTTLVRLLPHAYDLYRAHSSTWVVDYIYANPRMNYYSIAWDVTIFCGSVLFVVIIYFQQRFGGRCFIPKRLKENSAVYKRVSVAGSE